MYKEEIVDVDITDINTDKPDIIFEEMSHESRGFNKVKLWVEEGIIYIYSSWQDRAVFRKKIKASDDGEYYTAIEYVGKIAANKKKRYPPKWVDQANSYLDDILLN